MLITYSQTEEKRQDNTEASESKKCSLVFENQDCQCDHPEKSSDATT